LPVFLLSYVTADAVGENKYSTSTLLYSNFYDISSRFDDTLERLLACLRPVVMAEQKFCVAFFRMDSKLSAETTIGARTKTQKQVGLPTNSRRDLRKGTEKREKLLKKRRGNVEKR
jgi:hypothetical protein